MPRLDEPGERGSVLWCPAHFRRIGNDTPGAEYVVRNPRRDDRRLGSFKVNTRTGKWADFATGERGGDPIALAAYLFDLKPLDAARRLQEMLGDR